MARLRDAGNRISREKHAALARWSVERPILRSARPSVNLDSQAGRSSVDVNERVGCRISTPIVDTPTGGASSLLIVLHVESTIA